MGMNFKRRIFLFGAALLLLSMFAIPMIQLADKQKLASQTLPNEAEMPIVQEISIDEDIKNQIDEGVSSEMFFEGNRSYSDMKKNADLVVEGIIGESTDIGPSFLITMNVEQVMKGNVETDTIRILHMEGSSELLYGQRYVLFLLHQDTSASWWNEEEEMTCWCVSGGDEGVFSVVNDSIMAVNESMKKMMQREFGTEKSREIEMNSME